MTRSPGPNSLAGAVLAQRGCALMARPAGSHTSSTGWTLVPPGPDWLMRWAPDAIERIAADGPGGLFDYYDVFEHDAEDAWAAGVATRSAIFSQGGIGGATPRLQLLAIRVDGSDILMLEPVDGALEHHLMQIQTLRQAEIAAPVPPIIDVGTLVRDVTKSVRLRGRSIEDPGAPARAVRADPTRLRRDLSALLDALAIDNGRLTLRWEGDLLRIHANASPLDRSSPLCRVVLGAVTESFESMGIAVHSDAAGLSLRMSPALSDAGTR